MSCKPSEYRPGTFHVGDRVQVCSHPNCVPGNEVDHSYWTLDTPFIGTQGTVTEVIDDNLQHATIFMECDNGDTLSSWAWNLDLITPADDRPKLIYVAGPLSTQYDEYGTLRTLKAQEYLQALSAMYKAAHQLRRLGFITFNPGADFLDGIILGDLDYHEYFNHNVAILPRCDAVYAIGDSKGVREEIRIAGHAMVPVFHDLLDLCYWAGISHSKYDHVIQTIEPDPRAADLDRLDADKLKRGGQVRVVGHLPPGKCSAGLDNRLHAKEGIVGDTHIVCSALPCEGPTCKWWRSDVPAEPPTARSGHPRFYKLLQEMADLHSRKNHDYTGGGDPLKNFRMSELAGIPDWKGILVRIGDKYGRLCTFARHGELRVKDETVLDTWMDMAVYSLLGYILHEEALKKGA